MSNVHISMIILVIALIAAILVLELQTRKCFTHTNTAIGIFYGTPAILLGIIFGRLYCILFETSEEVSILTTNMQFAVFGVLLGAFLAAVFVCVVLKLNLGTFLDILAPSLLIVLMAQRICDFFLGTNFGRIIENKAFEFFPVSVFFSVGKSGFYVMAVFAYEFIFCMVLLIFICLKKNTAVKGAKFMFALGMYGLGRVVFESLRQDALYIGFVKVSQVVSIVLALAMLITFLVICTKKKVLNVIYTIIFSIVIVAAVTVAFLCEFYMGSEVYVLYTGVIAAMMLILAIMLFVLYGLTSRIEKNKKTVDIISD